MKEIKNWTVTYIDDNGKEGIGLLLPGCVVRGTVTMGCLEADIEVKVIDVDISNLIITTIQGEQYKLIDTSRQYLQDLKKCIEIGLKEKEQEKPDNVR